MMTSTVPSANRAARITLPAAHAYRRAAIAMAGVVGALGAHVASMGSMDVLPIAPAIWAMLIAAASVLGTRRTAFAPRGLAMTAVLVVASQAAMHAGMVMAPWVFGLDVHHAEAWVTPASLLAHVVASLVLIALVAWFDRILSALVAVARVLMGARASRRRGSAVVRVQPPLAPSWPTGGLLRAIPSRGPPVVA